MCVELLNWCVQATLSCNRLTTILSLLSQDGPYTYRTDHQPRARQLRTGPGRTGIIGGCHGRRPAAPRRPAAELQAWRRSAELLPRAPASRGVAGQGA